jgi:hypothetical protein
MAERGATGRVPSRREKLRGERRAVERFFEERDRHFQVKSTIRIHDQGVSYSGPCYSLLGHGLMSVPKELHLPHIENDDRSGSSGLLVPQSFQNQIKTLVSFSSCYLTYL